MGRTGSWRLGGPVNEVDVAEASMERNWRVLGMTRIKLNQTRKGLVVEKGWRWISNGMERL